MTSLQLCEQVDDTGCGVACVSMITGKSYQEVRSVLMKLKGWKSLDRNFYTRATDLFPLLEKFGIKPEIKKSGSWQDITGVSIVGVDRKNGYFHWVVSIKDSMRFIIIDPKNGDVLNGEKSVRKKRYKHGKGKSNYLSIPITISTIKI